MYWPNLQLTKEEAVKYTLYSEPGKAQRNVMYRVYSGELNITPAITVDTENIQISRRSRIFAMTASGDVHNTEVEIFDTIGERYTMGFLPFTSLFPGMVADARGQMIYQPDMLAALGNPSYTIGAVLGTGGNAGLALAPHVFEPNIVLLPNQTLSLKARALVGPRALNTGTDPARQERFTVSFCLHAWEFPVE